MAPFFLAGAGLRVHGGERRARSSVHRAREYEYGSRATVFGFDPSPFLEATPAVSLNVPKDRLLPGELSLGVGYRVNLISFQREKGDPDDPRVLAFDMSGASFSGVRIGAQYRPVRAFGVGLVFRNRVHVDAEADRVTVFTQTANDASLRFILPAKFGVGVDLDLERVRFASDLEYALQSQNDRVALEGTLNGEPASVPNVFEWQNGVTARFGVEYRLDVGGHPLSAAGRATRSTAADKRGVPARSAPPLPPAKFGLGGGFDPGIFRSTRPSRVASAPPHLGCGAPHRLRLCSYEGEYEIGMTGIYLDASSTCRCEAARWTAGSLTFGAYALDSASCR